MDTKQHVDSTILQDGEKLKVDSNSEILPSYQTLAGRGALQNHTETHIEAFVALKITYEHFLRKWKEQIQLLLLKNQRLTSEIQQLKGERTIPVNSGQGCEIPCNHTTRGYLERNQFKDDDMYGASANANADLVPYNLLRLHLKLQKLQQFPFEYRNVMENMTSTMSQQSRKHVFSEPNDFHHQVRKDEDETGFNNESATCDYKLRGIPRQAQTTGSLLQKEETTSTPSGTLLLQEGVSSHTTGQDLKNKVAPPSNTLMLSDNQVIVPTITGKQKDEFLSTENSDSKTDLRPLTVQSTLVMTNPQNHSISEYERENDQVTPRNTTFSSAPCMVCPVCSVIFPHGTKEENVASHVHLHFESTLPQNDSFVILDG